MLRFWMPDASFVAMNPSMTAREAAIDIIQKLTAAGYQALLAGGCVRDALMGREPKDYDVATSARPEQVIALFPEGADGGRAFWCCRGSAWGTHD